jgi:5-formyltetrahydrofolate cyclo-ligase
MDSALVSIKEKKRAVRQSMAERRNQFPEAERIRLASQATLRLLTLDELREAKVVAGFIAMRSEIDTESVLAALRQRGMEIVLPKIDAEGQVPRLRFHRFKHRSDLTLGSFGLLEPGPDTKEVSVHDIHLFIVPGLAFDRHGMRVGYGGGYYDECMTTVRAHPKPVAIFAGFAFDFQLLESCPTEEWDVPLDYVITDARIIRCTESDNEGLK